MIGELLIGFRRIIDFDFTINDEAWLRPSALNKLQKSGLIFSEWNDARSDRLALEPGFAEGDLEDAFLQSWCSTTCRKISSCLYLGFRKYLRGSCGR